MRASFGFVVAAMIVLGGCESLLGFKEVRPIPAPTIAGFTPPGGTGIGQPVVITGTNFTGASAVAFNGTRQPGFTVESPTRITTTVPTGATPGPITVTTPGGLATSALFPVLSVDITAIGGLDTPVSGCVDITYSVRQAQSLPANILVEFDLGDGSFRRVTQAGSPPGTADGVSGVTTSPAGRAHVFRWNSTADLPLTSIANARVRVSAVIPGIGGTGGTAAAHDAVTVTNGLAFAGATTYPVAVNPSAVAFSDLDADGKLDMVVANGGSNNVTVRLGSGDGDFLAGTTFGTSQRPTAIAIGDLNRDGRPDLAVGTMNSRISILLGTGTGSFQPAIALLAGGAGYSVTIADLDRDGRPDLLVPSPSSNAIMVFLGRGDGTFQDPVFYPAGDGARWATVGDLDRDGTIDAVTASFTGGDRVQVLLGNGDGSFQAPRSVPYGWFPISIAIGDINRDGIPDLTISESNGNIKVFF